MGSRGPNGERGSERERERGGGWKSGVQGVRTRMSSAGTGRGWGSGRVCNCVILLPFHVRVTAGGPEVYINTRIVLFISARCTTRAEFFPSFFPLFLSLSPLSSFLFTPYVSLTLFVLSAIAHASCSNRRYYRRLELRLNARTTSI